MRYISGNDTSRIPLYRWRQYRDYTLNVPDGRYGTPCMMVCFDKDPEEAGNLREDLNMTQLEYLILADKVISCGPLHLPTEFKNDPSSHAVGDIIFFNAENRSEAVKLAEGMPYAKAGLYKTIQVGFYNSLDVTGKFVAEAPFEYSPCGELREAMRQWGYPVEDDQTPWFNY